MPFVYDKHVGIINPPGPAVETIRPHLFFVFTLLSFLKVRKHVSKLHYFTLQHLPSNPTEVPETTEEKTTRQPNKFIN